MPPAAAWPANTQAPNTICSAKPMARPISTCCTPIKTPAGVKGSAAGAAGSSGAMIAVTSSASAMRMRTGTARAPKIGAETNSAPMRRKGHSRPSARLMSSSAARIIVRYPSIPGIPSINWRV